MSFNRVPSGIAGPASAKPTLRCPGRARPRRRRGVRSGGGPLAAAEVADAAPATAPRPEGPCCAAAPLPRLSGSSRGPTALRGRPGGSFRGEPRVPCRACGRLLSRLHRRGVATPDCSSHAPPAARDVCAAPLAPGHPRAGRQALDRSAAADALPLEAAASSCTDSRTAPAMERSRARRRDECSSVVRSEHVELPQRCYRHAWRSSSLSVADELSAPFAHDRERGVTLRLRQANPAATEGHGVGAHLNASAKSPPAGARGLEDRFLGTGSHRSGVEG
jgi:hypothetical protein